MIRTLALAGLAFAVAFGASAEASEGTGARVSVLGFSKDGKAFAYEQFGLSNADSYPYANLQILDTTTGLAMPGYTFRAQFSSPATDPLSVRQIVYNAADRTLKTLGIGSKGLVLARGSGDPADKASTEVPVTIDTLGAGVLTIESFKTMSKECSKINIEAKGLRIDVKDSSGAIIRRLVNLPKITPEQFCPVGYALVELRVLTREGKPPVLAMLLARTIPAPGGTERVYEAHVVDLANEPLATVEKKSGH